jgi:hypothetical protein
VDYKTEDTSDHQTQYLRTPTSLALGRPISSLGGKQTRCAQTFGMVFDWHFTQQRYFDPLNETGKMVGLGLDP